VGLSPNKIGAVPYKQAVKFKKKTANVILFVSDDIKLNWT